MASAEMVGIAQRLFEETLAYVKTREQFGQPIGRFQVIQHRMVDNYVALEKARSTLVWAVQEGWDIEPGRAAGAKAFIADLARSIAHDAIQLHGGMGMTDELLVGHGLKRILLLSRLFADPEHGYRLFEQEIGNA
jgi:alkylation response protein AidB-like acyl-CoA dehydrogenase